MSEKRAIGAINKKRYAEIYNQVCSKVDSPTALEIMDIIKEVLQFDPLATTYNEKAAQKIKEYRERKKAEGISTYISSGTKASYHKNKCVST